MTNKTRSVPIHDELAQLVRRYYPIGLESYDPRYKTSPELERLQSVLESARNELEAKTDESKWGRLVRRLREEFDGCIVWDTTLPLDEPCYSCRVYLPWVVIGSSSAESVVALISLLAPVYTIYAAREDEHDPWIEFPPLPAAFQAHEARLAQTIENEWEIFRLPEDTLFTPLPDLVPPGGGFELGQASLMDCLFTRRRR